MRGAATASFPAAGRAAKALRGMQGHTELGIAAKRRTRKQLGEVEPHHRALKVPSPSAQHRSPVNFTYLLQTADCNAKSTTIMLNAGVVNGGTPNFFLPHFCESFCDSGQILRFKNPVKYSGKSKVNGEMPRRAPPEAMGT